MDFKYCKAFGGTVTLPEVLLVPPTPTLRHTSSDSPQADISPQGNLKKIVPTLINCLLQQNKGTSLIVAFKLKVAEDDGSH